MENINQTITDILVDKLGIAETEVTSDANFIKDLGIDSLDYAELIMEFEQAFDIPAMRCEIRVAPGLQPGPPIHR